MFFSISQVSIAADIRSKLYDIFIMSLETASPQTELLYGSAALLQAGVTETMTKVSIADLQLVVLKS